jgi:RNA polymerase-binding transcription factor DksA
MLKKQAPRKKRSSFLTPDFLRKQRISLVVKLANFRRLQKVAREDVRVPVSDERRGDVLEQALTYGERQIAAQQLEISAKTIPQAIRALDFINNLLDGKKSGEEYGICIGCNKLIPQKRLEAVPWALCCIACQEKKDVPVLS